MIKINKELENLMKKSIRKYIDKNRYLFFTDNEYTVNCQLKPRLISNSVEQGFSKCQNKKLLHSLDDSSLKDLSSRSMVYAMQYINKKTVIKIKKEEKHEMPRI